jgi:glycosyltransferase involved in cell wall biosynthesis
LAAGVPLVALDFAPLNEIFALAARRSLDIGRVTATHDGDSLEGAVRTLLDAPSALERAGADAQRLVEQQFSLPAMVGRYADLYDQLEDASADIWQISRSRTG